MNTSFSFNPWFLTNWSRAGLVLAVVLLTLLPFLAQGMTLVAFLTFLQLPIYLFHQYEEHAKGAFKAYINRELGKGKEILTDQAIVWINIGGVWLIDLIALYLAQYINPSLGLIAIYLTVVNGVLHTLISIITRRYNPGLWTSLILFLPVSGTMLIAVSRLTNATLTNHLIGLGSAIILHIVIILAIQGNRLRLMATSATK